MAQQSEPQEESVCPGLQNVLLELEILKHAEQRPTWLTHLGAYTLEDGAVEVEFVFEAVENTAYDIVPVKGRIHIARTGRVDVVWLSGVIYHYLKHQRTHQLELPFEPAAVDDDIVDHGKPNRVHLTLQLIRSVLETPLHPCTSCNAAYANAAKMHRKRHENISKYSPLRRHPQLYSHEVKREWFCDELWQAVSPNVNETKLKSLLKKEGPGVYSFPLFTTTFCQLLVEELDNFSAKAEQHKLVIERPNSMNNYGVIVNSIGLESTIDSVQATVFQPIAALLFPTEGAQLSRHHSFVVQYTPGTDTHLDMHTDDSDVTFNVCLGKEFVASGLTFCGMIGKPEHRKQTLQYPHVLGRCVVHLGTRRHGADVIVSGERCNLITWCHNDYFRASPKFDAHQSNYEKESGPPDAVCVSYTHDRDYGNFKQYIETNSKFRGKGWCPPKEKEYALFLNEQTNRDRKREHE
eukprot:m.144777 g.144777  ORF g.144777 m.144777 type:complete len:464 (-) comp30395_c0_seq2:25-1416(-)